MLGRSQCRQESKQGCCCEETSPPSANTQDHPNKPSKRSRAVVARSDVHASIEGRRVQDVVQQHACMLNCVCECVLLCSSRGLGSPISCAPVLVPALIPSLPAHPLSIACCADVRTQTGSHPCRQHCKKRESAHEMKARDARQTPGLPKLQTRGHDMQHVCTAHNCRGNASVFSLISVQASKLKQGCCHEPGVSHPYVSQSSGTPPRLGRP